MSDFLTVEVDLSATDSVPEGGPIRETARTLAASSRAMQDTVTGLKDAWTTVPTLYSGTDRDDDLYDAFRSPDEDVAQVMEMVRTLVDGWVTAEEGADWWSSLTPEQQMALGVSLPVLVTNTEGVPYADRAAAGEVLLDLAEADPSLTAAQREDLAGIRRALDEVPPEAPASERRTIVSLRVDGEPVLAALATGNPDTAETVAVNVHGMGSGPAHLPDHMANEASLLAGMGGSAALITWVGYDAPNNAGDRATIGASEVLSDDHAWAGAPALALALDGVHGTRAGNADDDAEHDGVPTGEQNSMPRIVALSHSYGTPTTALALTMTRHAVDAAVLYGSVGVPASRVPNAEAMNVVKDGAGRPEVYATNARGDTIAFPLGQAGSASQPSGMRQSPTKDAFGSKVFSSDGDQTSPGEAVTWHGMIDGEDDATLPEDASSDGRGYLETKSQSLNAITKVVNGHGDQVPLIPQSPWDDDWDRHELEEVAQAESRAETDRAQTQRNIVIDAAQEALPRGPIPVPPAPVVDALQGALDAGVDARQIFTDVRIDTQQAVDSGGWTVLLDQ